MPRWFRRAYREWARRRLQTRGFLDFLASRPAHAIGPDFSDLWFLYQSVRRRKPTCILEFGSGCSTVLLAQALWDNERETLGKSRGVLYSIDSDPGWADVTISSLPDHLRPRTEVHFSRVLEIGYEGTPVFRHADVPDVTPDFLYLDGPPLTPDRRVAIDVLDMEPRFQPGFYLVVDGRKENTAFLLKHLKKKYAYKYRRQFRNSVFELVF